MSAEISTASAGRNILGLIKRDAVFSISLFLALASCIFNTPRAEYIDFKVLVSLFNLMIVIKAFEGLSILDGFAVYLLKTCSTSRKVSLVLIMLSFFMSMLVTNDIALITLVPLALIIGSKSGMDMMETVIFQTLAANIGSSLTPMGNPQNLFIYSFYKLRPGQFFSSIIFFYVTGFIWLWLLNRRIKNGNLAFSLDRIKLGSSGETAVWSVLFLVVILSVFGVVNYLAAFFLTLIAVLAIGRKLIAKIDSLLLLTFVCFFIFIGNLSSIPAVSHYMETALNSGLSTFFSSVILSQFISNVPSAVFLSSFTTYWRELLIGVNVGGMGTLIASLASVISYRIYIKGNPGSLKTYMAKFTLYNFASLLLFTCLNLLYLIFL